KFPTKKLGDFFFRHPVGELSETHSECPRVVFLGDRERVTREHVTRVHPFVHLHEADARFLLALHESALNGSRPAQFGQDRSVEIETAEAWSAEYVCSQNPPIRDDECKIGASLSNPGGEGTVPHTRGLKHIQAEREGTRFYGRHLHFHAPPAGSVGLTNNPYNFRQIR